MLLTPDNRLLTKGIVEVANYDADGRQVGEKVIGTNLRVVEGNEILARVMAGQLEYKIAGVYFEYENNAGVPVIPGVSKTDDVNYFHSLAAPKDFVRASLASKPTLSTGDSLATGDAVENNRAIFFSLAIADEGDNGEDFTAAANSKILTVGLVAMPVASDRTQDLLYARFALSTPFAKVAGQNPGVTWTTEFLTP